MMIGIGMRKSPSLAWPSIALARKMMQFNYYTVILGDDATLTEKHRLRRSSTEYGMLYLLFIFP